MSNEVATTYSVKMAAIRSGLSPDVIRIWERRYGAVVPSRTQSGHRIFSEHDINRLRFLRTLTLAGHGIGQLASLTTEQLALEVASTPKVELAAASRISRPNGRNLDHDDTSHHLAEQYLEKCLESIESLDAASLENTLLQASLYLGQPRVIDNLVEPLLKAINDLWESGNLRISHEHFATVGIRTFLINLERSALKRPLAPSIVVTTPRGQLHEMGALLVAATAAVQGWKPLSMGPNLPAREIAQCLNDSRAKVLALSIVHPENDARVMEDLTLLGQLLPPGIHVLTGGRAAKSYSRALKGLNAVQLGSMEAFRSHLDALNESLSEPGHRREVNPVVTGQGDHGISQSLSEVTKP